MKLSAYIGGIGVLGPGFANWQAAAAVLKGEAAYSPAATVLPVPTILPPAERRRTGRVMKRRLPSPWRPRPAPASTPRDWPVCFSSSGGDGHNCHELCQALSLDGREISPTRFSNSVHNAAAGYWSIATGAKLESNVLCAFDASFCAGLLEAMTQVTVDGGSLLLVAYDTEYPEPLHAKRPVPDAFGAALVLTPERAANSQARIEIALCDAPPDTMSDGLLESLRLAIPAARCLPLLRQLAGGEAGHAVLEYLDVSSIVVKVEPCV